jgi:DNA-directed RNA polymerase subunit RPC12/RpoP
MIHFACVYCGKKIRARDTQACRKAKCPACGHTLRVPPKARCESGQTVAASQTEERHTDTPDQWESKSNEEIASLLRTRTLDPEERVQLAAKRILTPLLPQYDDLTIFALSAAFLLVVLTRPESTIPPLHAPPDRDAAVAFHFGFAGMSVLAGIGLVMSLAGALFDWAKPRWAKYLMLCFAVLATGGIGIRAALIVFETNQSGLMLIFPLWNGLSGVFLLLMFGGNIMDPDCVVDCRPRLSQIVVTLVSIALLLAICRYAFNLHWAITYSICVCYTMSLNHTLQDLFGRRSEPADPEMPAQV